LPARTILVLASDAEAGESIKAILSATGYTVTLSADPADALAKVAEQQLVIIDLVDGPKSAAEICQEIRATPSLAAIPVMCVSATEDVEERIHFLEAGADDVMARPFDARELDARVEALLLRFLRSKELGPLVSTDGLTLGRARRTVVVYSPKGGVGTTTVATNIAIAAVLSRPDRVILVDLALQFGGVATLLNLDPRQTIADIVHDEPSLHEPELMRTYATRHGSGLHVLAAPAAPEAAETISPAHVGQILGTLLHGYDLVVVDAGSTLDERVLTVFEAAENILLVITPEIGALKAMYALLAYLKETGTIALKSTFVLNNLFEREILKVRDVESFLGAKMAVELPYDPFLYLKAVNEGVPIVTGAPRSAPAESLVKLSSTAFGEQAIQIPVEVGEKRLGGLFRRRR
jgi:pilus assembly protein CpaE